LPEAIGLRGNSIRTGRLSFWPGFRNNVSKYFFSIMRHYAYLLASAVGFSACSQRVAPQQSTFQKPRTVSTIPSNTGPNDTVLVFQRTPCYGTCPAYTATIFRSGKVSYTGERSVPVMGQHTFSIDRPPRTCRVRSATK
jgi:hypothetical protein